MTNCIETQNCMPTNPLDVFNIFDVWLGAGFTLLILALILGTITLAIYIRNRSLPMLTILGLYEIATFGSILTSRYFASQYHYMIYALIFGGVSGLVIMYLRLVKE